MSIRSDSEGSTSVSLLDKGYERSFEKTFRTRRRSPFTSDTSRETSPKTLQRFFSMTPWKTSSASGKPLKRPQSLTGPEYSRIDPDRRWGRSDPRHPPNDGQPDTFTTNSSNSKTRCTQRPPARWPRIATPFWNGSSNSSNGNGAVSHCCSPQESYSCSRWRSSIRLILPLAVVGSSSTNSIRRGYLYGAVSSFMNDWRRSFRRSLGSWSSVSVM